MHAPQNTASSTVATQIYAYFSITLGAILAAFAIDVFFIPNALVDGGIVGIAMIGGHLFGEWTIPFFLLLFNLPFMILGYRSIGRAFVLHMLYANVIFAVTSMVLHYYLPNLVFKDEILEIVVIGGAILGVGLGLIIRYGGCMDGTEILGLIINRRTGFTVGQVVMFTNIFVFAAAGVAFQDWHPPMLSLITYIIVVKIMDAVIVGLDETKSVLIISAHSNAIAQAIIHELGLGLTIMYGRGGFSGDEREILYVIAERLQLADLKELIYREDPTAFIAIENLHEVANGNQGRANRQTSWRRVITSLFTKKST